jgi:transglutaminase-like putative cysteine protease
MSWEDDPERLRAVCARAGCALSRQFPRRAGDPPAWLVECPSPWATVALLDELAYEDATDPALVVLARELALEAEAKHEPLACYLLAWVHAHVRFVAEPIEAFIGWRETIQRGGDCDDMARLLVALLRALQVPARLATLGDPPIHVAAQVHAARGWLWMEATVPGAFVGEAPAMACRRLGIPVRPDLGG